MEAAMNNSLRRIHWIETEFFDEDEFAAIRKILSLARTGQIVLNVSQGTASRCVVWRERRIEKVSVDSPVV
jgi:hypothetical protein